MEITKNSNWNSSKLMPAKYPPQTLPVPKLTNFLKSFKGGGRGSFLKQTISYFNLKLYCRFSYISPFVFSHQMTNSAKYFLFAVVFGRFWDVCLFGHLALRIGVLEFTLNDCSRISRRSITDQVLIRLGSICQRSADQQIPMRINKIS